MDGIELLLPSVTQKYIRAATRYGGSAGNVINVTPQRSKHNTDSGTECIYVKSIGYLNCEY